MVVFWAGWCAPCVAMSPTVEELAMECAGKVKVVKLNIDDNDDIASTYKISILPTVMFFKNGQKYRKASRMWFVEKAHVLLPHHAGDLNKRC